MKTRDLVFLITLPIGLLIGVSMLLGLADTEMAQFIDHLAMSGIIAYGVIYCFFIDRSCDVRGSPVARCAHSRSTAQIPF